jgi:hypothetical protein
MSIYDATLRLIDELNELGIEYVLVGSVAASVYSLSRATTTRLGRRQVRDLASRTGA